ncbi:peroxisomal sarcosine oxidase-like isoform X3 [Montipora foliosa]
MYDVCVIGAGVVGSATARFLASRGKRTLLLEQFPLPHWRGSSHGQTRVSRGSYPEEHYTKMFAEAQEMWKEIEAQENEELLVNFCRNVGMLNVQRDPGEEVQRIIKSLMSSGEAFQFLSNEKLKDKYPELNFSNEYSGVLEQAGGILKADKCLKALQAQFIEFGGTLCDNEMVVEIVPGSLVHIKTTKNVFTAQCVILAAGPWTNKLLKPLGLQLPLRTTKAVVLYWKMRQPGAYSLQSGFPIFADYIATGGLYVYAIPSFEYPGLVKFGATGKTIAADMCKGIDPDLRDSGNDGEFVKIYVQKASSYLKDHFPLIDHSEPAIIESCIYTITPDWDFVLDKHPSFPNIVIGAGFSAHGFKHGPVCGKILAQLAMGEKPSFDLSSFKIERFTTPGNRKASL